MSIRCFIPNTDFSGETIAVPPDAAHHLARVLRVEAGDVVQVFDGRGQVADAVVADVSKREVFVRITARRTEPRPVPEVTLVQALIRPQQMDWVVRKATELGVSAIQPVLTDRCVARTKERPDRWLKTAVSAAEQCGANWLPDIGEVLTWRAALEQLSSFDVVVLCSLTPEARPLKTILREQAAIRRVAVLVGPEGDFTPEETAAAVEAGAQSASLGSLVLRAETASLAVLAAIRYECAPLI